MLEVSTSIAQDKAGKHGLSLDQPQMRKFVDDLHAAGIMDHHAVEGYRKKKKLNFLDLVWAFFKNAAPIFAVAIVSKGFEEISPVGKGGGRH